MKNHYIYFLFILLILVLFKKNSENMENDDLKDLINLEGKKCIFNTLAPYNENDEIGYIKSIVKGEFDDKGYCSNLLECDYGNISDYEKKLLLDKYGDIIYNKSNIKGPNNEIPVCIPFIFAKYGTYDQNIIKLLQDTDDEIIKKQMRKKLIENNNCKINYNYLEEEENKIKVGVYKKLDGINSDEKLKCVYENVECNNLGGKQDGNLIFNKESHKFKLNDDGKCVKVGECKYGNKITLNGDCISPKILMIYDGGEIGDSLINMVGDERYNADIENYKRVNEGVKLSFDYRLVKNFHFNSGYIKIPYNPVGVKGISIIFKIYDESIGSWEYIVDSRSNQNPSIKDFIIRTPISKYNENSNWQQYYLNDDNNLNKMKNNINSDLELDKWVCLTLIYTNVLKNDFYLFSRFSKTSPMKVIVNSIQVYSETPNFQDHLTFKNTFYNKYNLT